MTICPICDKETKTLITTEHNNEVCSECAALDYAKCNKCGNLVYHRDIKYIEAKDLILCEKCFEERKTT